MEGAQMSMTRPAVDAATMAARRRLSANWPRLYVQLVRTREIFEFGRGVRVDYSGSVLTRLAADFGPGWVVWLDRKRTPGWDGPGVPCAVDLADDITPEEPEESAA
jgi:hypothetical protein